MKGCSPKESHTGLHVGCGSGCSCHWETPEEEDRKRVKGDRQQDISDVTVKMENAGSLRRGRDANTKYGGRWVK